MSALDKAFIKAHTKGPNPVAAGPDDRPAGMTPGGPEKRCDSVPPAPAAAPSGDEAGYRVDDAHLTQQGPHLPTCAALPQPDSTAFAGPLAGRESQAASSPPPSPVGSQRAQKLPSIFPVPDPKVDAKQTLTPDWEVDRLVWPTICERLLETETLYFRSVGQRLKDATQDSHHVVMITGARRGEGRTTLALCLARCAAQAGVAVAVVDADLENPQLGNQLGMETPCSWLEVVAGKSPLNEAAVSSLDDGLTLFPLTGSEDLETIGDDAPLTAVLRAIAAYFPLVIVDTGPLGSDDRHPFATGEDSPIDTAIVVRDLRNTTEKKALATAELLQRRGVPAVGIAENFRDPD